MFASIGANAINHTRMLILSLHCNVVMITSLPCTSIHYSNMSRQSPPKPLGNSLNGEVPTNMILPNQTPKCTWALGKDTGPSPHSCVPVK